MSNKSFYSKQKVFLTGVEKGAFGMNGLIARYSQEIFSPFLFW